MTGAVLNVSGLPPTSRTPTRPACSLLLVAGMGRSGGLATSHGAHLPRCGRGSGNLVEKLSDFVSVCFRASPCSHERVTGAERGVRSALGRAGSAGEQLRSIDAAARFR